ncbi:MAG: hypothetical protein AAFO69_10550 [Bacteroidota bacterium]
MMILMYLMVASDESLYGQDLTESWAARQVMSREEAKRENAFRHKINFFFGSYWNTSREQLTSAKIQIKNLKASGKMAKAKKLSQSAEFRKMQVADMKERAYISNEYGLFALEYVAEKGVNNLDRRERIFVEKAIYRSLSGPIANRVGYKKLLSNEEGRSRLNTLLSKVITDYQDITDQQDFFNAMKLPKPLREMMEQTDSSSGEQKIASFCHAATETFEKYAEKQKAIKELGVGSSGISYDNPELIKMSCEDKRLIVYKMIAGISK